MTDPVTFRRRICADQAGTAVIEAAICFPIVIILGFGVFEFANYFLQHQTVTSQVRDGARYLARCPDPTNAAYQGYAANLIVTGAIDGAAPLVPGLAVGNVKINLEQVSNPMDITTGTSLYRGQTPYLIVVTANATFAYHQIGLLSVLGLNDLNINVSHSERWIGQ